MTLSYLVNDVDGGDGGMSLGEFETYDEALAFYHECVKDYPNDVFDIATVDEDGEWIDVDSP